MPIKEESQKEVDEEVVVVLAATSASGRILSATYSGGIEEFDSLSGRDGGDAGGVAASSTADGVAIATARVCTRKEDPVEGLCMGGLFLGRRMVGEVVGVGSTDKPTSKKMPRNTWGAVCAAASARREPERTTKRRKRLEKCIRRTSHPLRIPLRGENGRTRVFRGGQCSGVLTLIILAQRAVFHLGGSIRCLRGFQMYAYRVAKPSQPIQFAARHAQLFAKLQHLTLCGMYKAFSLGLM